MTPSLTWEAFKQFIRVPYEAGPDVVSFQGTTTPDELAMPQDPPRYYVTLSRELDLSDDLGSWSRVVQIQWVFDVPKGGLSDVEHWSNEFPDLEAFSKHVESLPQFEALLANGDLADLYTVDLGPDGVPL